MSKFPLNERFERVLRFLLSLNNPTVLGLLSTRGFQSQDRREGWELFMTAAGRDLDMDDIVKVAASPNKQLIAEIDAWENVWFDVADAALSRKFPAVRERVFKNLSKTSGAQVVVTVKTLINRLDELEAGQSREDKAAVKLLAERGLDKARRQKAADLLKAAEDGSVLEAPSPNPESEEMRRQAVDKMWAWYMDWAQTARTVVMAKRLRIAMGISKPTSHAKSGEENTEEGTDDETDHREQPVPAASQPQPTATPSGAPA